ncbi:MAG: protein translocase subunit SecD [Alphaproteobacteria bacterium]|nr:protein translocase subunit SecD [Alphaproteobacteria bacterium]
MLYIEKWKRNLIIVISVLGVLYALPNVLGKQTVTWMQENLPSFLPVQTVSLGLDLRGGSHLLLEVEASAVIDEKLQSVLDEARSSFRKEKISYLTPMVKDGVVSFKLSDDTQADKAEGLVRELDRQLVVDYEDGLLSIKMSDDSVRDRKMSAMDQSIEIVRRRIDETGTREPSIQRQGDNRILVQLPGVDDPGRIKKLLGQTAKLSFRLVDENASMDTVARVPPGTERLPSTEDAGRTWVVQKRVMVSGDTLVDAQPSFQTGDPVVSFKFDSQGARRFGEATRTNVGRLFAIVLDGKVISAPVIREPITGGSGVISGHFTTQSAQDLALLLRAGALPAPIKVLEERTVGPGLGADSINAGAAASLIGLGLVILGVFFTYGSVFGTIANIALFFNIALVFAALSFFQATLTLPGIAGIVLTIGMAVDANVLIFERIREEIRLGRTAIVALDTGYKRALPSIFDANITTLIAAFLLFVFGSGPIKGFAVTLSIGIITSIFSAVMISHLMVIWWTQITKPKVIPI